MIENTVSKATTAGVTSAKPEFFLPERYMRTYPAKWAAFVAAVNAGTALPVALVDGVDALADAEPAALSLRSGATVILGSVPS